MQDFKDEETVITTDTASLKRASGQACSWEITSSISKFQYFKVELQIAFENVTNMDVMVISGYKRSTAYTVGLNVTTGTIISVPIYNTTWVIAVPRNNLTNNRIKFKTYVFREVSV